MIGYITHWPKINVVPRHIQMVLSKILDEFTFISSDLNLISLVKQCDKLGGQPPRPLRNSGGAICHVFSRQHHGIFPWSPHDAWFNPAYPWFVGNPAFTFCWQQSCISSGTPVLQPISGAKIRPPHLQGCSPPWRRKTVDAELRSGAQFLTLFEDSKFAKKWRIEWSKLQDLVKKVV